ncbi:DUF5667 domain-containing protein [Pseudonocardia humida]|uniref:DUF5667 domain-containing protein n=1 Tax=Pseudonocardia humida TaxID=2800819 RepID=A0ABT1A1A4_9PSEU|nr:DUF5667 domain-containing protein [Pseudonocardia humida]MCO1656775.1 hypothetical protein [Pseudonocardia humida]
MPAGDEEIFATAVDRGTHPAFAGDVELARDLELVALLQAGGPELAPQPDERARARAAVFARLAAAEDPSDHAEVPGTEPVRSGGPPQGTALLEAVVDEPEPEPAPEPIDELARLRRTRGARRHAMPSRRADAETRRPPIGGRIVVVAAAAVLGTAVLGGAGVLASRNALPGDGLYPVKRVAESAGLAMTFDETERGRRHLDLASTRIGEVEQLLAQDGAEMDPEVFRSGLQEFDTEADEGYRLLLSAEESRAAAEAEWQAWAADQAARLAALRGDLPAPAATGAAGSLERLEQLSGPGTLDGACGDGACTDATTDAGLPGTAATGTAPTDPAQAGRTGAPPTGQSGSGGGSGQGGQQGGGQDSLLPGLLPEDPLGGVVGGSGDQGPAGSGPSGSSSSDDEQGGSDDSDDPGGSDGGLPPVEVPPLLPGLPGVSIG